MSNEKHTPPRELVNKTEAARRLGVHPDTIERWGSDGKLTVYRIQTGGKRLPIRYDAAEVDALAVPVTTIRSFR